MVKKIANFQLTELLAGFSKPRTSNYYFGNWKEGFSEGPITLSVKVGEKRELVSGEIVWIRYEPSQTNSGYEILKFVPLN